VGDDYRSASEAQVLKQQSGLIEHTLPDMYRVAATPQPDPDFFHTSPKFKKNLFPSICHSVLGTESSFPL
jgi:hypothetical protein